MEPDRDFPAAHSMDTGWYAVDRDGHVALFQSGEAGAVPHAAGTEEGNVTRDDLAAVLPDAPYSLVERLGDSREEQHIDLPDRRRRKGLGPTLLFLDSLDRVREEVDHGDAEHAPATVGVAVLFHDLPPKVALRLHEAGACLGCFPWDLRYGYYGFSDDLVGRLGVFLYSHGSESENWIAGPYVREPKPERPTRLDQLPPEMREAIGRVRFADVSFAETERIQPVAHVPCSAWDDAYLDLDGRTIRPIPGQEAGFDPDRWADDAHYRVEVPPPPRGLPRPRRS